MEVRYFEHKTDSYKNNKRKLARMVGGLFFVYVPQKEGSSYWLDKSDKDDGKEVSEEVLSKYWKELNRSEFFEKEITHIPV